MEKVRLGDSLVELKLSEGWKVISGWLNKRLNHCWVDPRGKSKEEWEWAELNAFHSADVAKTILSEVDDAISEMEYLRKKERGEIASIVDTSKFDSLFKS